MRSDRTASTNGDPSSTGRFQSRSELESLRAECRRQAVVIDTLTEAVSTFRCGATALKAENSDLRSENHRLRDDKELLEVAIALDASAPGAARAVVAECLEDRVVTSALYDAQLLVSELVANSLLHCGGPVDDQVVVSVELTPDWFRVGVRDSGSNAVIAAQPANLESGGGFGLNLVHMLSERWGVERLGQGGTPVWAQLLRSPLDDSLPVAARAA